MTQNTKVLALALAGGYLLGRTKKAKLALAAASIVLGRRKGLNPQRLLTEGLKKLSDMPEFSQLNDQLRGELMTAGRSLVMAAANRRLDSLSNALHDRTESLSGLTGGDEEEDEEPEDELEEDEDEEEAEDGEEEDEEEPEEEPRERRPARKAPAGKAPSKKAPAKKTAAKKSTSSGPAAKKTAAKKTAAKKAPAKRSAAKKTSSRSTRGR